MVKIAITILIISIAYSILIDGRPRLSIIGEDDAIMLGKY